jgi:hypothetical protein
MEAKGAIIRPINRMTVDMRSTRTEAITAKINATVDAVEGRTLDAEVNPKSGFPQGSKSRFRAYLARGKPEIGPIL